MWYACVVPVFIPLCVCSYYVSMMPMTILVFYNAFVASVYFVISLTWPLVTDELSSGGDSRVDDDPDKKSPKDKDSKDRERDREEGSFLINWLLCVFIF